MSSLESASYEAWKLLTDPGGPWAKQVIGDLIGETIPEDWDIVSSLADLGNEGTGVQAIVVTKDFVRSTIRLEPATLSPGQLALQLMEYNLTYGECAHTGVGQPVDVVRLPQSFVVNISDVATRSWIKTSAEQLHEFNEELAELE